MGANIEARITKDFFMSVAHKIIFQVIADLKARGTEVDLLTLVSELGKRKQLDAAGGAAYVAALTNIVASTVNTPFYETEVLAA
jgi:replicative DNA helicase